ncbi:glutathione S-transferase family protein [Pararhizobium capsulatum]|nr:glutathione S-transferase family protein [Pararhizobium capsulatum]
MSRLELISHGLCPYVQRAAIALAEKNVPFTRIDIDLANKPAWFKVISPLGKVPLLKVDDRVLFESAVICDYLDETTAPRLHPSDPFERARHRGWIEFGSAVLNDIWRLYSAPDEASFIAASIGLKARLRQLEATLDRGPYFSGSDFSLVDAAFAPVFRYFDVFDTFVDLEIVKDLPKVQDWRRALSERPSVQVAACNTYPEKLRVFLAGQNSYMSTLLGQQEKIG